MVLFLLSLLHVKQLVKLQEHLTGSTSRKKKKEIEDLNLIFKSVITQKDEKEQCKKGDKCKFSHDDVENKSEKKSIYVDLRDEVLPGDWYMLINFTIPQIWLIYLW
ncbi:zinc finger CCCH domain-containing protein 15-like isoform X2 [Tachypleus tridentatus]|uniref:zinc finger CCCH domain-containing protein 15-like isoform X2 n=1 Tax=Tachypleus tridentatus TaxID=6853 RepID=UPI003FD2D868